MSDIKVAVVQADIHWENIVTNLAAFEEKIWRINNEIDIIILPEMFTTGFSMNPAPLAEVEGLHTHKWLLQMANQKHALVGGSYIVKKGTQYFNRFVAAFPDGSFQFYDKRHLFTLAGEEQFFVAGSKRLILEYKGWKICPLICYDLRFPAWAKNAIDPVTGAYIYDLLIYVASWPKPRITAWDTLLQARAIENQCYTAGCNRVGVDANGNEYVGHSAIYNYLGEPIEKVEKETKTLYQTLYKSSLKQFRLSFPFLVDSDQIEIKA